MEIQKQGELEHKARNSNVCPVCGDRNKNIGAVVCWGECWRGENGLKYTDLDTEEYLKKYSKYILN